MFIGLCFHDLIIFNIYFNHLFVQFAMAIHTAMPAADINAKQAQNILNLSYQFKKYNHSSLESNNLK